MKNASHILYAAICCAALAIPGVLTAFSVRLPEEGSENRELAPPPALKTEDGKINTAFLSEADAWFTDHFSLRGDLVTFYGALSDGIFSTSPNEDVIIGKDGWLYYAETVNDYQGIRTLSVTDVTHLRRVLEILSAYAEQNGAKLIFAPAPNKSSIYPQYMPGRYLQTNGENNLDAVFEALKDTSVTVCDLRATLREAAKTADFPLYHRLDTHWNGDGAMLAYNTLMRGAGESGHFSGAARKITRDFTGDLWQMLYPSRENPDENAVYDIPSTYRTVGRYRGIDDMTITTRAAGKSGSLLMFRDSFGRALIPLFAESFGECVFSRAERIPFRFTSRNTPDLIIYEIVERNLENLLVTAPDCPAPQTELPETAVRDGQDFSLYTEQSGDAVRFCGLYDEQDAEEILCAFADENGETYGCYEAFPCCETELLHLDERTENGFSLSVSSDALPQSGKLLLFVRKDGKILSLGAGKFDLRKG